MGNQPSAAEGAVQPPTSESGTQTPATTPEGLEPSGVYIGSELQAKIMKDIQSQMLQEEWEGYQQDILTRRRHLSEEDARRRAERMAAAQAAQEQNAKVQARIDAKLDAVRARLDDLTVQVSHDTNRLLNKLPNTTATAVGAEDACTTERFNVTSCWQASSSSPSPTSDCSKFVDTLEACVKKHVVKK